jgi:hypothetical protein
MTKGFDLLFVDISRARQWLRKMLKFDNDYLHSQLVSPHDVRTKPHLFPFHLLIETSTLTALDINFC